MTFDFNVGVTPPLRYNMVYPIKVLQEACRDATTLRVTIILIPDRASPVPSSGKQAALSWIHQPSGTFPKSKREQSAVITYYLLGILLTSNQSKNIL